MPKTVNEIIKQLKTLPNNAIVIDAENTEWAINNITYDEYLDNCKVEFTEINE